jgi:hypothetical protein
MDFGLARTVEGDGMTQTGALVGTMEYMSPEQALAKGLDQRSDLFTLGLILYELLTGKTPYMAESVVASLIKRTQERALPVSDHDGTIPGSLSNIVSKCLERDANQRYQTASELLRDLEEWQGKGAAATLRFHPAVEPWGRTVPDPAVLAGGKKIGPRLVLGSDAVSKQIWGHFLGLAGTQSLRHAEHRCGTIRAPALGLFRPRTAGFS